MMTGFEVVQVALLKISGGHQLSSELLRLMSICFYSPGPNEGKQQQQKQKSGAFYLLRSSGGFDAFMKKRSRFVPEAVGDFEPVHFLPAFRRTRSGHARAALIGLMTLRLPRSLRPNWPQSDLRERVCAWVCRGSAITITAQLLRARVREIDP